MAVFSIINLSYSIDDKEFFKNFNLEIQEGDYFSIIGPNKCGKTMLTKIMCAILPTYDFCYLDDISLNKENCLNYITKIGIVSNDLKIFLKKTVKDELAYPLENLGYSEYKINKIINKMADFFEIEEILDQKIDTLDNNTKSKLLIVLALIHDPKLLVLDDAFNEMNHDTMIFMLKKLKILNNSGLTIINLTSNLETIYDSKNIALMNNFNIVFQSDLESLFEEEKKLIDLGLEIPYVIKLSLKLKELKIIDKIYFNLDKLENDLWK